MTYATSASCYSLGSEWWDNSVLDPKEKKTAKPDTVMYALADPVRKDIMKDSENPRQLLPKEYEFVNDTANLLVDRARMIGSATEVPHDQIELLMRGTANYIKEDQKYINVFPEEKPSKILGDIRQDIRDNTNKLDEMLEARVEDAMEVDAIIGDGDAL